MQKYIILVTAVLVAGIVGFVVWSGGGAAMPSRVEVEVLDGEVNVSNLPMEFEKNLAQGEKYSTDETVSLPDELPRDESVAEPVTLAPTVKPTSVSTDGALAIQITDALQDEISKGTIEINGEPYEFSNGIFSLEDPPEPPFSMVALADGYFSATRPISAATELSQQIDLMLEYKVSFEFEVYQDMGFQEKAVGAQVILRKAVDAQRPMPTKFSLDYNTINVDFESASLRLEGDHLLVLDAKDTGFPPYENKHGFLPGDQIYALEDFGFQPNSTVLEAKYARRSNSLPLKNPTSRRLRLMDALMSFAQGPGANRFGQAIQYKRNGKSMYTLLRRLEGSESFQTVGETETDATGRCRFDDLRPGLYFVEAILDNHRSHLVPVHPAFGGFKVRMSDESRITLHVVRKAGDRKPGINDQIEGADIMFKSIGEQSSSGMFGGKSEKVGWKHFDAIPYGEYQLTVIPPDDAFCQAYSETFEVKRPSYLREIQLKPQTSAMLSISGRVFESEPPHRPVKDYPVKLTYRRHYVEGGTGWGVLTIGEVKTGPDGRYEFTELEEGTYDVCCFMESEARSGYFPVEQPDGKYIDEMHSQTGHFWGPNTFEYILKVKLFDNKVDDADFYVTPSANTTFRGLVLNSQNQPIEGAFVTLPQVADTKPKRAITNQDGSFEITMFSRPSNENIQIDIRALKGEIIPAQHRESAHGGSIYVEERIDASASALETLDVKLGEDVNGIQLIVTEQSKNEVRGTIR